MEPRNKLIPSADSLKRWQPIALVLLLGSLVSAVVGLTGVATQIVDRFDRRLPFPVVVGYFHANGQNFASAETLRSLPGRERGGLVYYDAAINLSGGTFAMSEYRRECGGPEISEVRGMVRVSVAHNGWFLPESPKDRSELEVFCGLDFLVVDLISEPTSQSTPGVHVLLFSGLFEVTQNETNGGGYSLYLRQVELPLEHRAKLRSAAEELWQEFEPVL